MWLCNAHVLGLLGSVLNGVLSRSVHVHRDYLKMEDGSKQRTKIHNKIKEGKYRSMIAAMSSTAIKDPIVKMVHLPSLGAKIKKQHSKVSKELPPSFNLSLNYREASQRRWVHTALPAACSISRQPMCGFRT